METNKMASRIAGRGLTLAGLMFAALAGTASAQGFPTRTVTIVVPFAAGGATDILARIVAQELNQQLGQSVIIENRAGAGGGLGAAAVAKATPDGYTLLLGTVSTHAINPALYKSLAYDVRKDFAPIVYLAGVPNVLVVSPKQVLAKTVPEFVAEAKKADGKLNFASSGAGSSIHLSGEMFKVATGVKMTHVPYRGSAPAIGDLVGGKVDLMFDNLPSALPHIQAGTIRALAVTSAARSSLLPNLPTLAEAGIAGVEASSWFALFAPTGTSEPILARLRSEVEKALAKPEVKERLAKLGAEPRKMDGATLTRFIDAELARWAEVVRKSGAKVD